jgi:hypothetical protein
VTFTILNQQRAACETERSSGTLWIVCAAKTAAWTHGKGPMGRERRFRSDVLTRGYFDASGESSCWSQNVNNKEIAAKRNVSVRKMKFHVSGRKVRGLRAGGPDAGIGDSFTRGYRAQTGARPRTIALGRVRSIALLPEPTLKLCLAASVARRAGRTVEGGERTP